MRLMRVFFPLVATMTVLACTIANWPHAPGPPTEDPGLVRVISPTLYTPYVHRLSVESCKIMFPPDTVGGLCDYNDGLELPDACRDDYHMETQRLGAPDVVIPAFGHATLAPTRRKVCHLNTARGERGAGLECATTTATKGTP